LHLTESYSDYLERKQREASGALSSSEEFSQKSSSSTANASETKKGPSNNQKRSWQSEKDQVEKRIAALEKEQAELQAKMQDPETYANKALIQDLLNQQRKNDLELEQSFSRWEELGLLLESN
jgi:hypothetical protein